MGSIARLQQIRRRKRRTRVLITLTLVLATVGFSARPAYDHLRAASVLTRVAEPTKHTWLTEFRRQGVDVTWTQVNTSIGTIPGKLYIPSHVSNAPAIVIVHGVHHLGIEEPRLVSFANALSSSGLIVFTPQVNSLADYSIDQSAVTIIGDSVLDLSRRTGAQRVGLMGLSFAGGLALCTAADPRYSGHIAYTVAVGAHDDLGRVLRFFATDQIQEPNGTIVQIKAHEYGMLVAAYSHIEDFFEPADRENAREALRQLLYENTEASKAAAEKLSHEGVHTMNLLYAQSKASIGSIIVDHLPRYEADLAAVSPHGKLAAIKSPVYLLHGAGDNVIPSTETEWLAQEIPAQYLQASLISPAISHVEVGGQPTTEDKARLLHWLAQFVAQAHAAPASTQTLTPALPSTQAR